MDRLLGALATAVAAFVIAVEVLAAIVAFLGCDEKIRSIFRGSDLG